MTKRRITKDDAMVVLSKENAKLFHYEGEKTDQDVRAHWVYAVNTLATGPSRHRGTKTARTTRFATWMRNLFR